jgi:hypothetical protein
MVVEVYLRNKAQDSLSDEEALPNNLLELETMLKELEMTAEKLRDSTDLLTEEFRKSEGDEAREFYEYIQDNLGILKSKNDKMKRIDARMQSIGGVFKKTTDASSSSGAGGLMDQGSQGHFI